MMLSAAGPRIEQSFRNAWDVESEWLHCNCVLPSDSILDSQKSPWQNMRLTKGCIPVIGQAAQYC
jgi:hypothetical protein